MNVRNNEYFIEEQEYLDLIAEFNPEIKTTLFGASYFNPKIA